MSIACMNYVWQHSETKGADRLMLLALADSCGDDGEWSPGVTRLSDKCNVEQRAAQYTLRRLEAMGEIEILEKQGFKTKSGPTNKYIMKRYRVMVGLDQGMQPIAPLDDTGMQPIAPQGMQPIAPLDDTGMQPIAPQGMQPIAPKPSDIPTRRSKPSELNISSDDGVLPGALLRSLLESAGFTYFDKDFTRIATGLEERYTTEQLVRAVESTRLAHQRKIAGGERGITAPLAYMAQILVDEKPTPPPPALKRVRIFNQYTGKHEERTGY